MKIVSVSQMRQLDQQAIKSGIAGEQLMERAGHDAYEYIVEWLSSLPRRHRRRVSVIAGKGNNGGDAYVVARLLAGDNRFETAVYSVCPKEELSGDARTNADRLPVATPFFVCPERLPDTAFGEDCVIIDGLLGTGISGDLRPPYHTFIEQINHACRPVAALDIPSGLNGDTGEAADNLAVQSDLTISMGLPKQGLFRDRGRRFCGRLRNADIGLPSDIVATAESVGNADFSSDIAPLLRRRPVNSHKNMFGHTLVIAGSSHYIGAPSLVAQGALHSGAGLVTAAVPEGVWTETACPGHLPAALIVRSVASGSGVCFAPPSLPALKALLKKADAAVIGPGIGTRPKTATVLETVLKSNCPIVVDADGLNLIAAGGLSFRPLLQGKLLTPHPGEMARLLIAFELTEKNTAPRPVQASALARVTGAVVVLKGSATVTATPDGEFWINSSGTSGLATAGTGDVLAGLAAGMLAQGLSPLEAARTAVFTHGLASEIGSQAERALIADDLLPAIGKAFKYITPFG